MGKQSRRKRDDGDPLSGIDLKAVAKLSRFMAFIRVEGKQTIFVDPMDGTVLYLDFDRAMCKAGLRRFIRPRMDSDWDGLPEAKPRPANVLVRQLSPDVRVRRPLVVVLNHEMN